LKKSRHKLKKLGLKARRFTPGGFPDAASLADVIASHDARATAALKSVHQRNDLNEKPKPGVDHDTQDRSKRHLRDNK
jgi:hypothetical protein